MLIGFGVICSVLESLNLLVIRRATLIILNCFRFLEREFIDGGFDAQHLIRLIYKVSGLPTFWVTNSLNEDDEMFSRALPRRYQRKRARVSR